MLQSIYILPGFLRKMLGAWYGPVGTR